MNGKKIILGVSGGVAAYKAAELVRLLVKANAEVHVVMTEAAQHFVGSASFQALSGKPVWADQWDMRMQNGMAHIDLSRGADAILIAPASADILAKLTHGLADDLLSTLCLARECPLLVAPAMNRQMWQHPATQRNVTQLQQDGITILGPASGEQACGETGLGRMLEAEELFESLSGFFQPKLLAGKRVLLTAGPTYEAIDPVRGITNISSGKMGYALARACAQAGAHVELVSGPVSLNPPLDVTRCMVQSATQMRKEVLARVAQTDIFIAVAAVADFRPQEYAVEKIKKSGDTRVLNLQPNPDILAEIASLPKPPFCVGFAAESHNLDTYAQSKRQSKKLPMLIGNLVDDAMGQDENTVVIYDTQGQHALPRASKEVIAAQIVEAIARAFV